MQPSIFEAHRDMDPRFPIIFHLDTLQGPAQSGEALHWHEDVELLFCIQGEGCVLSNASRIPMKEGELAVVNANHLHMVLAEGLCRYYCLIVGKALTQGLDLPLGEFLLQERIAAPEIQTRFQCIIREMEERQPYYKPAVLAEVAALSALICRSYAAGEDAPQNARRDNRVEMVKSAVAYIRANCAQELSVDEICRHAGFSKYYFCRTFKEITGFTVVGYINFLRCQNARALFSSGEYNISESAERSGFHNMSYFTRTYKALMGGLPSEQRESLRRKEQKP